MYCKFKQAYVRTADAADDDLVAPLSALCRSRMEGKEQHLEGTDAATSIAAQEARSPMKGRKMQCNNIDAVMTNNN